jgi:hypothetical protein
MERKCRVLVFLIVGCVLSLQTGCQQQASKITFEEVVSDFGEVGPNTKRAGEIKFTNAGESVLKITKVSKCCGVVAKLDKDTAEYAPGESGAVKIEWKSGREPGAFSRQLMVHSNDKINPAVTLTIKAMIVLKVVSEPERLRLLLNEENAGCPKLTLRSIDNQPFSITGFQSTGDCITADYDPSVKATEFILEPKVKTEKLHENLQGSINMSLTHPEGNTATIHFDVLPKYTISHQSLVFLDPEPEKPMVRKISVLSNYAEDFEIESVSSRGNTIAVKILEQKKIRNGYQLDLEITPPAAEGGTRFTDELSVNIKGGEKLAIRCNGWYSTRRSKSTTQ